MIIPAIKTGAKVATETAKALPSITILGAMGRSWYLGKGLMGGIAHDPIVATTGLSWFWQSFMATKLVLPSVLAKAPLLGGLFTAGAAGSTIGLPLLVGVSLGASILPAFTKASYKGIVNFMAKRQAAKLVSNIVETNQFGNIIRLRSGELFMKPHGWPKKSH